MSEKSVLVIAAHPDDEVLGVVRVGLVSYPGVKPIVLPVLRWLMLDYVVVLISYPQVR